MLATRRVLFQAWQPSRTLISHKRRSFKISETPLGKQFKMEYPKITIFGDSITRRSTDVDNGCWASMIEYKAGNWFDVDTRGFEGYNTKWAVELLPKLFPKSYLDKVEIFIPFFGHNDSWESTFPTRVSVAEYEQNTRAIIKYLNENGVGNEKIIMITPCWFHLESFTRFLRESNLPLTKKEFDEAKTYGEAVKRVAKDNNIEVLDFFGISSKYQPLENLFCDGVHLSRTGAKLLYDNLIPIIERKVEARYKKPLADLWHVTPFDQLPEVKSVIDAFHQQSRKS